mgnify:CR=1 FL=1
MTTHTPSPTDALQKAREIAALEAKALPAPFFDGNTDDGKRLILSGNQKDSKYAFDVTTQQLLGPSWYIEESAKERNATCDFLIEIRNAFPSIHAELEKVTAERDELLKGYREMRLAIIRTKQDVSAMRDCRVYEKDEIISYLHDLLTSFPEIK